MLKYLVFGAGASVFLAAACGGSSDDGGGGQSLAIDDLPAAIADAECALVEKCFGPIYAFYLSGVDCKTQIQREAENGEVSALKAAVEKGDVTYDGKAAAACLQEIGARSCEALSQRSSETCDKASEGKVVLGESCTYDFECQGQAFCKYDTSCPGKCTDRQPAGSSCDEDDQCADGLVCSEATDACAKPAALGAACGGGGAAPPCEPFTLCAGEDPETSKTGTCMKFEEILIGDAGATCELGKFTLCKTGLACVIDNPQTLAGTCQTIASSGSACKVFAIPSGCPAGEFCEAPQGVQDGTCKPLPGPGQPCAQVLDGQRCAPYSHCEQSGTCKELQDNGGACGEDATCYSKHCVGGVCRPNECSQ